MKCYVVVDTNVLVSALLSKHEDAATVQVLNRLFDDDIGFLYSSAIESEYKDVLNRPKFNFPKESITTAGVWWDVNNYEELMERKIVYEG